MTAQTAYRVFIRRVAAPVVSLVVLLLLALLATLVAVAWRQTAFAQGEQARLAERAMLVRGQHIEKSAMGYGAWDVAAQKLATAAPDLDWADENIGRPAFRSLGFDMSFVLSPDSHTRYATIEGERSALTLAKGATHGVEELISRQRFGPREGATSGLVRVGGALAIMAVAPIRPLDPERGGRTRPHLLVFIDKIDAEMLAEFSRIYLLPGLRLANAAASGETSVPLSSADGARVGVLAWRGAVPGDALLKWAAPVWAALAIGIGLMVAAILQQARAAAALIERSEWRASHDALTGLPNRVQYFETLHAASLALADGGQPFSVAYLDLDGFKSVNDTHGHDAGDIVLKDVARRIIAAIKADDCVARFGGDEFALLLRGCVSENEARRTGLAVIHAIEQPIELGEHVFVEVSATLGAAFAPHDGADPLTLLRSADMALNVGKRSGKRQVQLHAGFPGPALAAV